MAGATTNPSEPDSGSKARNRDTQLDLASVLSPYARHRMILIRLEQLPLNSDLSAGNYAGPRTWSLKPDELNGLIYTPPEGHDKPHTLKVRILSLNNNIATTLAVVDVQVTPGQASATDGKAGQKTKAQSDGGDLAAAKEAWEAVTELRIQQAVHIAQREATDETLRRLNDDLAGAKQGLADARTEFESKAREQASTAEQNADARLKAAESEWQTEMARSVRDSAEHAEKAETTLAEFQTKVAQETDAEQHRLSDELAAAEQALADARAEFDHRLDKQAAIAEQNAETGLKAAEKLVRDEAAQAVEESKARAEAAEAALAKIQNQADQETDEALLRLGDDLAAKKQALAEANARADEAEKLLAQAGADVEGEIADLRQRLAEAEAAQGDALDEGRRAREGANMALSEQIADAVHKAEQKAESRLKAAEETWAAEARQNLDTTTARADAAEKSLADLRASGEASTDSEVRRLGDELTAARQALDEATARAETAETTLARTNTEIEAEIAQLWQRLADEKAVLESALDEAREQARAEAEAALSDKIADAVHTTEARAETQLQTAEESWRAVAAHNLADVTARAEQAETALAGLQAKKRASSDKDTRRLGDELAAAKQALADNEAALADARATFKRESDERAATAEQEAGERLQAAEESWRAGAARELDEMKARVETAEAALAGLQATTDARTDDELQRLGDELATAKQSLADSEAALGEARAALDGKPESDPAESDDGARPQSFLQKAQQELAANAERKTAEATARAERAESELVKARMQVDRRSEDVVRDLENEVKTLQLALAAGESALADSETAFNRKLEEQRALYQQTAQKKAELMLKEARKGWEADARAAAEAPAETSPKPPANDDGGDPPPAGLDNQKDSGGEQRGWWRSLGMGGGKNS
ncbi:MAG: hypothetical protein V3S44_01130 [Alphaproteobacteria bacterium]